MTTIPNGLPAWVRANSHTDYGGDVDKHNYLSQGVVDAQTDVGAEAICRLAADMEAIHRTAPFCKLQYLNNDSSPAAPTINIVHMQTGVRLTSYAGNAAPTGFPSAARNGNGDVTFTFAASYLDPYGVSGPFQVSDAHADAIGSTVMIATPEIVSATTVRVRVTDGTGTALLNKTVQLEIS